MSTIGKLFGRSPFKQIQQHMDQVTKCIVTMNEALDTFEQGKFDELDDYSTAVSALEHQADQIKDDIRNQMLRRIFLPIDRSDVLEILSLQDSLADRAEDVCVVMTIKQLPIPDDIREPFNEFRRYNVAAFETTAGIIDQLDELIESGFGGAEAERIRSMAHDVSYAEHQADIVQIKLLKRLYAHDQSMSVGEFHLWMRFSRVLGSISNISENLADLVLKTLSLK